MSDEKRDAKGCGCIVDKATGNVTADWCSKCTASLAYPESPEAGGGLSDEPEGFCTECTGEIQTFNGLTNCPHCGTKGVPCAHKDDVEIKVNWHELRLLIMWAERWQRQNNLGRVVYAIAHRIKAQYPERSSLTLAGDLGEVAQRFPGTAVTDPKLRQDIAEQVGIEVNLKNHSTGGLDDA